MLGTKVVHRPGKLHQNADALSRDPLPTNRDQTSARLDHDEGVIAFTTLASSLSEDPPVRFYPEWPLGELSIYTDLSFSNNMEDSLIDDAILKSFVCFLTAEDAEGQLVGIEPCEMTLHLDLSFIPTTQLTSAMEEGITLYEPFGGLAAGLEMVLRNNIPVKRYIYSDINQCAQEVAKHRIAILHHKYQNLLPKSAWQHAFDTLPMDISEVNRSYLYTAGAKDNSQRLVVAGWECQD